MLVRRPSAAFWLVLPAMLLMGFFFVLPIVASLLLSFTDFDLYALARWDHLRLIGFENYRRLFTDPLFFRVFQNRLFPSGGHDPGRSRGCVALPLSPKVRPFKLCFVASWYRAD